jgi:nucleoside-diphosphate-sugar epimerase
MVDHLALITLDMRKTDPSTWQSLPDDPDIVFHLASAGVNQANQDAEEILQTNVMGTLHLLQMARKWNVERFVYCGSCFEYPAGRQLSESIMPAPMAEYGASKTAGWILTDTIFRRYGLPVVTLRPFTTYGPWEGSHRLVPHTITNALRGGRIDVTGGKQTRDFVFVEDVVEAFLAAALTPQAVGATFNVCTGQETSVRELVTLIVELTGNQAEPVFGAIPYRDTEIWSLSGNPSKSNQVLGWSARTSLRAGLSKTIQWFRERPVATRFSEHSS